MKFKRNERSGGVAFELEPEESQFPIARAAADGTPLPIFRLKKILVPVDFSDRSQKAVAYATALARQFAGGVTLLHVVPPLHNAPELAALALDDSSIEQARRNLDAACLNVRTACPCDALVLVGLPGREIASAAAELSCDLIIVSTRRRNSFARAIHKSVAEQVVRTAPCPVLVLREKEKELLDLGET